MAQWVKDLALSLLWLGSSECHEYSTPPPKKGSSVSRMEKGDQKIKRSRTGESSPPCVLTHSSSNSEPLGLSFGVPLRRNMGAENWSQAYKLISGTRNTASVSEKGGEGTGGVSPWFHMGMWVLWCQISNKQEIEEFLSWLSG